MNKYFAKYPFGVGEEERLREECFDINMNPREWIARFGHNILCGDMRIYIYTDKKFEKWIYEAFEAFRTEGLEKLWSEFLTEEEIEKAKEARMNP